MTRERSGISDFDLMAYSDGRLDPHRRRLVEAWLTENPEEAEKLRTDAAITQAIRALYDPVLTEPVPQRLEAAIDRPAKRPRYRIWRYSAMAASMIGAGAFGWWVGDQTQTPPGLAVDQRLLNQVTTAYREGIGTFSGGSQTAMASAEDGYLPALSELNERMTFEVQAPDLTALGYRLVGQRVADTPHGDVVEVNYANSSGERIALFLRTRWQDTQPRFRAARLDEVSTAYWYDGPLALALVGDAEPEVIRDLGMSVHDLMKADGLSEPALQRSSPAGVTAGEGSQPNDEIQDAASPGQEAGPMGDDGYPQTPTPLRVPERLMAPATVQPADHEM